MDFDTYLEKNSIKRFLCEICGHSYQLKRDLDSHLVKHESDSFPYICFYCCKSFSQKYSLSRHMVMHTDEKPYECKICNKSFVHHSSYNFHQMCHSGARPHKCPLCDYGFRSTTHLKRHLKIHFREACEHGREKLYKSTKEKINSFRCYVCEDSFNTFHELERHTVGHVTYVH